MKETEWKEIITDSKSNFIRIIQTLNRYYTAVDKNANADKGLVFRRLLESLPSNHFSVFLKKFGKYEYLVHAKLGSKALKGKNMEPPPMKEDTWIHIDGIQEERDSFTAQGISEHPVFQIEGLTDIYESGCIATKRRDLPK